jgi:hypothetical protein
VQILLFANSIWRHAELKDHWVDLVAIRLVSVNQIVNPWAYIICRVVSSPLDVKYFMFFPRWFSI